LKKHIGCVQKSQSIVIHMEAPIMLDSSTISPQTVKPIYRPMIHNATHSIQYLTLAWNMFMHSPMYSIPPFYGEL